MACLHTALLICMRFGEVRVWLLRLRLQPDHKHTVLVDYSDIVTNVSIASKQKFQVHIVALVSNLVLHFLLATFHHIFPNDFLIK